MHEDSKDDAIITADQAWSMTAKKEKMKDINYSLTLQRLMKSIAVAAKQGYDGLEFQAPTFVLDGSIADPVLLARQLSKKLRSDPLNYKVKREGAHLDISWKPEAKSKDVKRKKA